jgi:hypothetical protein
LGMVAILFPATGVASGCLQMAARVTTYPDIFPGRRNGK